MKIRITGERGREIEKSVEVEVEDTYKTGFPFNIIRYTVRHTDGKIAFINSDGGCYYRMCGSKFVTLMKACTVEKA